MLLKSPIFSSSEISTLKNEETKFKETLERGMGLLEKSILDLSSA